MPMNTDPTIQELFHGLTEADLKLAEETLDRYLAIVTRIVERIESERNPQGHLTQQDGTLRCTPPDELRMS